jgi:hydroxyacylglutathione hydrolase
MKTPIVNLIPAFEDNYFFCLSVGDSALVVDPGSSQEVLNFLAQNDLKLKLILATHHHSDHIGGAQELINKTGAQLYGPSDLIDYGLKCDKVLSESQNFEFEGVKFNTLGLPGHTQDHLAYYCSEHELLFCGDTLFSLGCGRLFEGTFDQMYTSLSKIRSLPDSTKVFCAHEYTMANLKFTLSYLKQTGGSLTIIQFYTSLQKRVAQLREKNIPTIPSTIGFEKQFNLFLKASSVDEFRKVREARNSFNPDQFQTPQI